MLIFPALPGGEFRPWQALWKVLLLLSLIESGSLRAASLAVLYAVFRPLYYMRIANQMFSCAKHWTRLTPDQRGNESGAR